MRTTKQTHPLVSIIILTYNSQDFIRDCLQTVLETDYPNLETLVIDNNSSDKTLSIVKKEFPDIKTISNKTNFGYAKGNNIGVNHAHGTYIAILNPDTIVSKTWLKPLLAALNNPEIGISQPKIMLKSHPHLINLTGKNTHFLGFEFLKNYQKNDFNIGQQEITSFSGSAFLIKRQTFLDLGGFDEDFFMYCEDGDLSWRSRLMGLKILLVPNSVVYHDYKFQPKEDYQKSKTKFYYLERNRLLMITKNYSLKTLLLILPALLVMEFGMIIYFTSHGWFIEKFKGYLWILSHLSKILNKRRVIQEKRLISDEELTASFTNKIEFKEIKNFILNSFLNPLLAVYWKVVSIFI